MVAIAYRDDSEREKKSRPSGADFHVVVPFKG
jgi:hypothetical protein